MWETFLRLLFPARCIFCGDVTQGDPCVCRRCLLEAEGKNSQRRLRGGEVWAVAPLAYEGKARRAVGAFKFQGRREAAALFASLIRRATAPFWGPEDLDLITCVPMLPAKEAGRGYNQADLLARAMAEGWGLAYEPDLLCHVGKDTQHELTAVQRAVSVEQSFAAGRRASRAAGMRVLLVDDVITTGQTMSRCRRLLEEAGAAQVRCVAAAMVPRRN